jgi:hypothetical protein
MFPGNQQRGNPAEYTMTNVGGKRNHRKAPRLPMVPTHSTSGVSVTFGNSFLFVPAA